MGKALLVVMFLPLALAGCGTISPPDREKLLAEAKDVAVYAAGEAAREIALKQGLTPEQAKALAEIATVKAKEAAEALAAKVPPATGTKDGGIISAILLALIQAGAGFLKSRSENS